MLNREKLNYFSFFFFLSPRITNVFVKKIYPRSKYCHRYENFLRENLPKLLSRPPEGYEIPFGYKCVKKFFIASEFLEMNVILREDVKPNVDSIGEARGEIKCDQVLALINERVLKIFKSDPQDRRTFGICETFFKILLETCENLHAFEFGKLSS